MNASLRAHVLILLVTLVTAANAAEDPPRTLSPKRVELHEAVEEFHLLRRRAERGGQSDKEIHELKHSLRRARERVKSLKHQILKEERRPDDYYQDDPYPTHKKDPETGQPYNP